MPRAVFPVPSCLYKATVKRGGFSFVRGRRFLAVVTAAAMVLTTPGMAFAIAALSSTPAALFQTSSVPTVTRTAPIPKKSPFFSSLAGFFLGVFRREKTRSTAFNYNQTQSFAYDQATGHITSESFTTYGDSNNPALVTTMTHTGIKYDTSGHRTEWTETTTSNADSDVEIKTVTGATYDCLNRLKTYYQVDKVNGVEQFRDEPATNFYDTEGRLSLMSSNRSWNETSDASQAAAAPQVTGTSTTSTSTPGTTTSGTSSAGDSGGGGVTGLSSDWKSGNAAMVTTYSYYGTGNTMSGMTVTAKGAGTNTDAAVQAQGINLQYAQSGIHYNGVGQVTGYHQSVSQVERYTVYSEHMHGLRKKISSTSVVGMDTVDSDVSGIQTDDFGRQVHSVVNSNDHGAKATVRQETTVKDFNKDGRVNHQEVQTTSHIDIPASKGSFMQRLGTGALGTALLAAVAIVATGGLGLAFTIAAWAAGIASVGSAMGRGALLGGKTIISNTTTLQTMAYKADGSLDEAKTNAQTQTLSSSTKVKGMDLGDKVLMASDIAVAVAGVVVTAVSLGTATPATAAWIGAAVAAMQTGYNASRQGISTSDFSKHPDRAGAQQRTYGIYEGVASAAMAGIGGSMAKSGAFVNTAGHLSGTGLAIYAGLNAGLQMGAAAAAGATGKTVWEAGAISLASGLLEGSMIQSGGGNSSNLGLGIRATLSAIGELVSQVGGNSSITTGSNAGREKWGYLGSAIKGIGGGQTAGQTVMSLAQQGAMNAYEDRNRGQTMDDGAALNREVIAGQTAALLGSALSIATSRFLKAGNENQWKLSGVISDLWAGVSAPFEALGTSAESAILTVSSWVGNEISALTGNGAAVSKQTEKANPGAVVNPAPANPSAVPAVAPKNAPAVSPTSPKPGEQKAPVTVPSESGQNQKNAPSTLPEQKPNLGPSPLELIPLGLPLVPGFRVQGTGSNTFGPLSGLSEYFAPLASTQGSGTSLSEVINASSSLDLVSALTLYAATWTPRQATGELVKYASNILEGRDYMVVGMSSGQGAVLTRSLTTLSGELAKRQQALAGMNLSPEAKADLSQQLAAAGAALKGLDAGIKGGSFQDGAKDELLGRVALAQFDTLSTLGEIKQSGNQTAGSRLMIQAYTDAAGELDLASRLASKGGTACLTEAEIDYAHAGSFTAVAGLMLVTNGNKAQVGQSEQAMEKALEVVGAKEKILAGMEADLAKLVRTPGAQQTVAGKASALVKSFADMMAELPLLRVKDDLKNILYTLGGVQFVAAFRTEITKERATLEGQQVALAGAAAHFDASGSAVKELEVLSAKRDWTTADVERFNQLATTAGAQNTIGLSMAMEGRLVSPVVLVDKLDMTTADKVTIKDNFLGLRQEVVGLKAQAEALLKSPGSSTAQSAAIAAGLESRAVAVWGKTEVASEALNLHLMTQEVEHETAILGSIGKGAYVNIFTNELKDAKQLSRAALMDHFGSGDAEKMVNLTQTLEVKGVFGSIGKLVVETAALGAVGKFMGIFTKTAEAAEAGTAAAETAETAGVLSRIIGAYAALGDVKTLLTTTGKMGAFGAALDLLASNGKALLGGKDVVYGVDMMGHRIVVNQRDVLSFSEDRSVGLKGFITGASFVKWSPLGEGLSVALKGGAPVASYWIAKIEGVGELSQKGFGELAADALQGNGKAALAFTARGVESLESMGASMGTMYAVQKAAPRITDILGLDPMWGNTFAEAAGGVAGGLVRGAKNVTEESLTEQRTNLQEKITKNQALDESWKQQRAIYESQLAGLPENGGGNGNLGETIRQADGASMPSVENIAGTKGNQNSGGQETSPVGPGPVGGGRPADVQGPGRLEPEQRGGEEEASDLESEISGFSGSQRRAAEKIKSIDKIRSGIQSEVSSDQAGVQRLTRGIEEARQRVAAIDDQNGHISDVAQKLIFKEGDDTTSFIARLGENRVLVVGLKEGRNVSGVTTQAARAGADLALVEQKTGAGAQYIAMDVAAMNGKSRVVSLAGLPSDVGVRIDANTVSYDSLSAAESALDLHMAVNAAPESRMAEQQSVSQQMKGVVAGQSGGLTSDIFFAGVDSAKSLWRGVGGEGGRVALGSGGGSGVNVGTPSPDSLTNVDAIIANANRSRPAGEIDPRIRGLVGDTPEVLFNGPEKFSLSATGRPNGDFIPEGGWEKGKDPLWVLHEGNMDAGSAARLIPKDCLNTFHPTPEHPFGYKYEFEQDGYQMNFEAMATREDGGILSWTSGLSRTDASGSTQYLTKHGTWVAKQNGITTLPFTAGTPSARAGLDAGHVGPVMVLLTTMATGTSALTARILGMGTPTTPAAQTTTSPGSINLKATSTTAITGPAPAVGTQTPLLPPSDHAVTQQGDSTLPENLSKTLSPRKNALFDGETTVPNASVGNPAQTIPITPSKTQNPEAVLTSPTKPTVAEASVPEKDQPSTVKTIFKAIGEVLAAPFVAVAKVVGTVGKFLFVDAPKDIVGAAVKVVQAGIAFVRGPATDVVTGGLSIPFGGKILDEKLQHYTVTQDKKLKELSSPGNKEMGFYVTDKAPLPGETPSAVFDIRHNLTTTPLLNVMPHFSRINIAKGENADDLDVCFNEVPAEFIEKLKSAKSLDVFVHGFNVGANDSLKMRKTFSDLLSNQDYHNVNASLTWSGDAGNNFISKPLFFKRSEQVADMTWPGVARMADFAHSLNPDLVINPTTHSLGARLVLDAAANGVKFGTVVLIVPAVDNDALCPGGKFEKALPNIDRLVIVYSRHQEAVFGSAYRAADFGNALGYTGPAGVINHPNLQVIDGTDFIKNHCDIYNEEVVKILLDNLRRYQ